MWPSPTDGPRTQQGLQTAEGDVPPATECLCHGADGYTFSLLDG